jgi:single-stranded-DNA-specific exonuclease
VGLRPGRLDAYNIAFQLAPRINAAGRVAKASVALRLLITDNADEAARLAGVLERENTERQRIEGSILNEALGMLDTGAAARDRGIVLYSDKWHPGVIGIVASRLVERFGKPAVMIALDGGLGKGSARGVKSIDILEGLRSCSGLLLKYGGHRAAAGLTVEREKVEEFALEFIRTLNATVTEEDLVPEVLLDAAVSLNDIDLKFITELEGLAPFGVANREPVLCLEDAHINETEVVKDRHLRFLLTQDGCRRKAIGFGLAGLHPIKGEGYNVAFTPYVDEWRGARNPGIKIKDVQSAAVNSLT